VRVTRDQWSYWLLFGDGDVLVIDSMAVEPGAVVERIAFDDGTVWTPDDLASLVDLLPGTALGDALWGTVGNDTLEGLGGDDQLFGNGGNDVLAGGEGSDLYYFATGDGADVVDNYDTGASFDTIYFADASSTDATLAKSGNDLFIRIGEGADRVQLSGWYRGAEWKVDEVVFVGDFVGWDAATLEQLAPAGGANNPPEVANPLADQLALEDEEFSFSIPQGSFGDADADELAYSASLFDGADLPAWLSFDPEQQLFSGTPANADVAALDITVTATDPAGEAASDSFTLEVINTNDAPVVAGVIADVQVREGEALAFSLSPGLFSDPDANDHLSLAAAMADGSALPGWLSFDGTSFRGTPGLSDAGEYVIKVTARDDADASADTSFRVMVEDTPVPKTLVGTRHKDVLRGTAADEVLVGLGGNDELRGGKGDDLYVHGSRDGHDEIVEAGGDFDVIRFGEGITREMVRAKRHHDDLVLDVSGPHGSVTVTGWFASKARRVEFVQFANGTVWDEDIIRRLLRKGDADDGHHHHKHADRDRDERPTSPRADEDRQAGIDWYRSRDAVAALISERLSAGTSFDFEALRRQPASKQLAPDPQEIARQWARAHSYASALAFEADESATSGWQSAASKLAGTSTAGFGFEASIGATRAQEGLRGLEGLTEGFRKL
jgi:Ca2+-binding RTX toxin-like protein